MKFSQKVAKMYNYILLEFKKGSNWIFSPDITTGRKIQLFKTNPKWAFRHPLSLQTPSLCPLPLFCIMRFRTNLNNLNKRTYLLLIFFDFAFSFQSFAVRRLENSVCLIWRLMTTFLWFRSKNTLYTISLKRKLSKCSIFPCFMAKKDPQRYFASM